MIEKEKKKTKQKKKQKIILYPHKCRMHAKLETDAKKKVPEKKIPEKLNNL